MRRYERDLFRPCWGVKPEEIEQTVLLPTHLRQEHPEDKLGIQLAPFPLWPERSVFYLAKMYTGEIQKGESYGVLQKCIHVGILFLFSSLGGSWTQNVYG